MVGIEESLKLALGTPSASLVNAAAIGVLRDKNPALWMYERLGKLIFDFEKDLDPEHEIGARLVSFGSQIEFHIAALNAWGPDMIMFEGVDGVGNKVQLIQHISQLSVLLIALRKLDDKARRIGFQPAEAPAETEKP